MFFLSVLALHTQKHALYCTAYTHNTHMRAQTHLRTKLLMSLTCSICFTLHTARNKAQMLQALHIIHAAGENYWYVDMVNVHIEMHVLCFGVRTQLHHKPCLLSVQLDLVLWREPFCHTSSHRLERSRHTLAHWAYYLKGTVSHPVGDVCMWWQGID